MAVNINFGRGIDLQLYLFVDSYLLIVNIYVKRISDNI